MTGLSAAFMTAHAVSQKHKAAGVVQKDRVFILVSLSPGVGNTLSLNQICFDSDLNTLIFFMGTLLASRII